MLCSAIPFFVLSFVCLLIICLISPNLMSIAAMVTIFVNFFNIGFILERAYHIDMRKPETRETIRSFISEPSPEPSPYDNLLRRELPSREPDAPPREASKGAPYRGGVGAYLGDIDEAPSLTSTSALRDGSYSSDTMLASFMGDRRANLHERKIAGTMEKVRLMKGYLQEECGDIENRDWWGNHEI